MAKRRRIQLSLGKYVYISRRYHRVSLAGKGINFNVEILRFGFKGSFKGFGLVSIQLYKPQHRLE